MAYFQAVVLGIVQGLTEFLPVSSSAHLILARALLGWDAAGLGLAFDVACHVGTLGAVVAYFRADIVALAAAVPGFLRRPLRPADAAGRRLQLIAAGTVPVVIVGVLFADAVEETLRTPWVTVVTLVAVAILFLAVERAARATRGEDAVTPAAALAIGVAQAAALVPGVSRSGATITTGMFLGIRREAAARFSFLLGVPAILAAAAHEGLPLLATGVGRDQAWLFLIGSVVSGLVGYVTIKYFLKYLVSHTLAPFAWYRIALAAVTAGWLPVGAELIVVQWLRRRFVTGFVVTVPLVISLVSLVWVFRAVDGLVGPVYHRWIPFAIPGLGIVTTAVLILAVGTVATNVFGKRLLQRAEGYLMMVPVFRTIYSPVKQIVAAFSPDNKYGFKKVALVEDPRRGRLLGFLTKEFSVDLGSGPEPMVAVYVPTNHLYLGDLVIVPSGAVFYPDLSVEDGVRIILTGGMALPPSLEPERPVGGPGRLLA